MATYYVRPDGNDANTGTGPATNQAWQTIQKALSNTSGLAGGDIVYIAPGRYVELVTAGISSPSSQIRIVGDPTASQFSGVSPGVVRHTNIYSNGSILGLQILTVTSINNLSFENIYYENGNNTSSGTSRLNLNLCQGWQFKKCIFENVTTDTNHNMLACVPPASLPSNGTIESCIFVGGATQVRFVGNVVADSTSVRNCLFMHGKTAQLNITGTQTQIYNCTFINTPGTAIQSNPYNGLVSSVRNCLIVNAGTSIFFIANNSSTVTNTRIIASGGTTNIDVSSPTNSTLGVAGVEYGYNLLHNIQAIYNPGTTIGSVNTSFGTTTGAPSTDLFGIAWSGTSPDAGAITYRNLQTITPIYQPTERNASTITIAPGSTSQSIELYLGATGLTASTSGLSARYNRTRTASVSIPLVARTIAQAWTSGGFAEVDATNMPGVYRLDLPDAALAAGADDVTIVVRGASGTNGAVMTVKLSSGGLTSAQTASAVWGALTNDHTTHGTFGWNVLRADQDSKEGLVTLHQSGGVSRVDADIHAIANDTDAATELKGALLHNGTDYISAELLTPVSAATSVHIGPYQLLADGLGADQPLDVNVGTATSIDVQVTDANGTGIDITGATVSAKVYNAGGTLVATYAGTATYADNGRLTFGLTTTVTNTSGTYTVTVTRTTGASDTQVFGPLKLYVRPV